MDNTFCKIENYNVENKNIDQYILTDKFKQPLQCNKLKNTCFIQNFKQIIDNPILIQIKKESDSIFDDTKIPCTIKKD